MLSKIPDNSARPLLEEVKRLQDSLFLGLVGLPAANVWPNHRALAGWVKTLSHWSLVPELVDARFIAKNSVWAKHSITIASSDTPTKAAMRKAWESHGKVRDLYANGSAHALEMPDWAASPAWESLQALMASFYGAALGDSEFNLANGRMINRSVYVAGFSNLAVCPYWDCGLVPGEAQLDHFLPVSLFPFLSVCPDNLVPVSHGPNRRGHKGNRVALDAASASQTCRAATEWFHPKWLDAVGKIDAAISRAPTKIFSVQVQAVTAFWKPHVTNFDELVDLSHYWSEETNARWRDDLTSLGQEMNRYGPTAAQVVQGRLADLSMTEASRPFTLLHKGKFGFILTDASILSELEEQAAELQKNGVGAFKAN